MMTQWRPRAWNRARYDADQTPEPAAVMITPAKLRI
jgi:hypothetical protein